MFPEIDIRVSPSLHPKCIEHLDAYTESTAPYVSSAIGALTSAYQAVASVHDARAAASQNPVWNEAEQIIRTDSLAQEKIVGAAKALDASISELGKKSDDIEKTLTQPLVSKAALSISQEIRAHVKSMETGERLTFIRQAINQGDEVTVTALLGAPSYLCGLDQEMHGVHVRMWHEKNSPELAARLKVVRGAHDYLGRYSGLLHSEMSKAVGTLTDSKTGYKFTPHQLREAKKASEAAFYAKN